MKKLLIGKNWKLELIKRGNIYNGTYVDNFGSKVNYSLTEEEVNNNFISYANIVV